MKEEKTPTKKFKKKWTAADKVQLTDLMSEYVSIEEMLFGEAREDKIKEGNI